MLSVPDSRMSQKWKPLVSGFSPITRSSSSSVLLAVSGASFSSLLGSVPSRGLSGTSEISNYVELCFQAYPEC
jgi:hypothetical protein